MWKTLAVTPEPQKRRGKKQPKKPAHARPLAESGIAAAFRENDEDLHKEVEKKTMLEWIKGKRAASDAGSRFFEDYQKHRLAVIAEEMGTTASELRSIPLNPAPAPKGYSPCRNVDELRKRKSLRQVEAAGELGISTRQVRTLCNGQKLTKTSTGRIVVDGKFIDEFNSRHGNQT
jgi:hypothetical protein